MSDKLVTSAREARESAYAPYSEYKVGTALRTDGGTIYTGCNIEVVNLSNSLHAEEVALCEAVKNGDSQFDALAVSTRNGGTPCGMCRQTLAEFCEPSLRILIDSANDDDTEEFTLGELYPAAFSDL